MSVVSSTISPCVGICEIAEESGWCLGCARSPAEIALWSREDEDFREAIWKALPRRFAKLGVVCRRLPWDNAHIADFVTETIEARSGTWVLGVLGAVGEFFPKPGRTAKVCRNGNVLTAMTDGATMRLLLGDDVRALTFDRHTEHDRSSRLVLAVKRERGGLPTHSRLTDLGEDQESVEECDRQCHLVDLGVGFEEARFCIRLRDIGVVKPHLGTRFPALLPRIGPELVRLSPDRIIETALGRLEVSTPIPHPGEISPKGPHTHLLTEHLVLRRTMPPGLELPPAYLPGAIFYPV